jgi:DNA-binding IclR family transcriptional regulator
MVLLSSDIKLELLRLFRTNPKFTFSSAEIAKQIGRTKDEIQPELNGLVAIGVLKRTGGLESFCLDEEKDREIRAEISRYLLRGENWTTRSYCETIC